FSSPYRPPIVCLSFWLTRKIALWPPSTPAGEARSSASLPRPSAKCKCSSTRNLLIFWLPSDPPSAVAATKSALKLPPSSPRNSRTRQTSSTNSAPATNPILCNGSTWPRLAINRRQRKSSSIFATPTAPNFSKPAFVNQAFPPPPPPPAPPRPPLHPPQRKSATRPPNGRDRHSRLTICNHCCFSATP